MGLLKVALLLLAHSDSGASDPGSAVELQLGPGEVQLGLDAETSSSGGRSDEDPAFFETVEQAAVRPLFAFSPLRALTVMVQVPVVHRHWSIVTEGYPPTEVRLTGLGDADVGARYLLINSVSLGWSHALAISAGATLPTGDNSAQQDTLRHDEHAQLGRGSVAPHASIHYVFERARWSIAAAVAGRYQLRNGWDYQYAPSLGFHLRTAYSPVERLSVCLGIDGRFSGKDADGRVLYQHTGGFALMLATMLRVRLFGHASVTAMVQAPLYLRLNGDQQLGTVLNLGLQYLVP